MEILIIYLVITVLINIFSGDKNKKNKDKSTKLKEKRKTRTKISKPKSKRKKSSSIFSSFQENISNLENELKEIEKKRRREINNRDVIDEEAIRRNLNKKRKKESETFPSYSRMKGDVLTTEKKVSSMREEGYHSLADEKISESDLDEYERSLYGDDEDSSLFDYNYKAIAEEESEEEINDVFTQDGQELDLKKMVIVKEILDKPLALRK